MADSQQRTYVLAQRLARAGVRVGRTYAEDAKREAARDLQRLAMGVGMLMLCGLFSFHALAIGHALLVVGLVTLGLPPVAVLGVIVGLDILLALILAFIAKVMLTRPLLPQTRAHLKRLKDLLAA